jgi:transcriptional regulator NrdR family protein
MALAPKLLCPHCGEPSNGEVKDSRVTEAGDAIRRRRHCNLCRRRFTTYEFVADSVAEIQRVKGRMRHALYSLASNLHKSANELEETLRESYGFPSQDRGQKDHQRQDGRQSDSPD